MYLFGSCVIQTDLKRTECSLGQQCQSSSRLQNLTKGQGHGQGSCSKITEIVACLPGSSLIRPVWVPATLLLPFMTTQSRWLWPNLQQYKPSNLSAKKNNMQVVKTATLHWRHVSLHAKLQIPCPVPVSCEFPKNGRLAMLNLSLGVCVCMMPCDRLPPSRDTSVILSAYWRRWIHRDIFFTQKLNEIQLFVPVPCVSVINLTIRVLFS